MQIQVNFSVHFISFHPDPVEIISNRHPLSGMEQIKSNFWKNRSSLNRPNICKQIKNIFRFAINSTESEICTPKAITSEVVHPLNNNNNNIDDDDCFERPKGR